MSGTSGSGVVMASYGRGVSVQTESTPRHCALKGRKQRIVCGDRVDWRILPCADEATIESVAPQRSVLERIDARGRAEAVAANLDRVAIVVAAEPEPDWFVVDRYWAAARFAGLAAMLVVNKRDLGTRAIGAEVAAFRALSLPCFEVSALAAAGLPELRAALGAGVTLLAGQSGVGKSSLINALIPDAAAQTAALTRDAEGRHTTTTARWYVLGAGAAVIDAPGVRDFAPPAPMQRAAEHGFAEIEARLGQCRFNDCRHLEEPGCAMQKALAAGQITPRRYESYRRLLRLYERLGR